MIADKYKRRMPLAILFTILCCIATMLLGKSESIYLQLIMFSLAVYSFQSALVFYNSVLPQIVSRERIGRVSGYGVSLGYLGTIFGLLVVNYFVCYTCYSEAFMITAGLFLLFSFPFFISIRDENPKPLYKFTKTSIESIKKIKILIVDAKSKPGVLRFLIGRFFVVEALETVVLFMAIFLKESVGLSNQKPIIFGLDEIKAYLILVTIFTAIGSFAWGFVTDKIGSKKSLITTILLWIVTLVGFMCFSNKTFSIVLGSLAGISLGGVWTSERPLLINLVNDKDKLSEFFGLFALSGRMAAVIGPLIWGSIILICEPFGDIKYKFAIGSVLTMMIIGLFIIRKVPDAR